MEVLKHIKAARKEKGISQKKMAELLNISQPGYQKIEQGINALSIERFLEICNILQIDSYNSLLPSRASGTVEEIAKVLTGGSLAFEKIRRNANFIRRFVDEIKEDISETSLDTLKVNEKLEFMEDLLLTISKESSHNSYQFLEIQKLIDKVD